MVILNIEALCRKMGLLAFLLGASPVSAQIPEKPTISIREVASEVPGPTPAPGKKCKWKKNIVTYTPTVVLGSETQDGPLIWRFHTAVETDRGEGILLVSEKVLEPGGDATVSPIIQESSEFVCSCCRPMNRKNPKILGWVAQLTKGDQVIAQARSSSGGMEVSDLLAKNQAAPKDARRGLRWETKDKPAVTALPASEITPARIAPASRRAFADAVRLKSSAGPSLYVNQALELASDDIQRVSLSGRSATKIDSLSVYLSPSGLEKIRGAGLSSDRFLVVISGGEIVAGEVQHHTYRQNGVEEISLSIRGRFSEAELEDLAESLRAR